MSTCPTCGQPVRVHQSSEGTGCFVTVQPSEEKIRAAFEAWMHKAYVQPLLERWEEDEYYYAEQSTQDEYEAYLAGYSARPESEAERVLTRLKDVLFGNVHCVNFIHEQRNLCFQMQGLYDGSISAECKQSFQNQFELWDSLIKEHDARKLAGETTTKGE